MSVEIVWSPRALRRLESIRLYVARDKPRAAETLAKHIIRATEALRTHPELGRARSRRRLRELIVAGTPYIIVYRIHTRRIVIATVWHAAQQRAE